MVERANPPAEFELQILAVLWEHGPATVRQVLERLADGKERAYTSVLSVMQVMQKKGLLATQRQPDSLAHVYSPLVSRESIMKPMLNGLVQRIFGGKPTLAVQQILADAEIPAKEIDALRKLLDDIEQRAE